MRILVASRVFPPDVFSGASTVVWNIWERLREEHDVRLVCGWQYDASLLPRGARGVRIDGQHRLRSRAAMDLAVRREARSFRPDVVLAHGLEVPVDLAPTVGLLTDPGDDSGSWGRLGVARRKLVRSRIEKMAIPVVPTEAARTRWIEFGVRADRLRVAWPGVDTSLFSPDESVPPLPSGTIDTRQAQVLHTKGMLTFVATLTEQIAADSQLVWIHTGAPTLFMCGCQEPAASTSTLRPPTPSTA